MWQGQSFSVLQHNTDRPFGPSSPLLNTYLLSPWSSILLEKPTGLQPVKKFPVFYGTRKLITTLTSARHLSLSCASSMQSIPPRPTFWRSVLILSSHLRLGLPSGLFLSGYPSKNPVYATPLSHTGHTPRPFTK